MATDSVKIPGAKFFQERLDSLRLWVNEASKEKQLPASAMATYILYHFECDDFGRILAKEFCLKHAAEEYNLPYTSLHNGHHRLLKSGWIREEWINEEQYYTINQYAELNDAEKGKSLNYFIIPKYILKHAVLTPFISSRDTTGILGMLDLINGLYRGIKIHSKKKIERKTNKLLSKLNKSSRTFKDWAIRLTQVFNITFTRSQDKEEMWIIEFVDGCFEEPHKDPELSRILTGIRKDITSHFTHSSLSYRKQNIQDVYFACKQELVDLLGYLPNNKEVINRLHTYTMEDVLGAISESSKIKSIGAYYRELLRKKVIAFIKYELNTEQRLDLHTLYYHENKKMHRNMDAALTK
jgi:hypothetical protein